MRRIALYIDTDFNGTGVTQYIKSLLKALESLSPDYCNLTVFYTSNKWREYLNKFKHIDPIFIERKKTLNYFYQVLLSFGLFSLSNILAQKFDKIIKYIDNKNYDYVIFPSSDTIACFFKSNVIGTVHDLMHRYKRNFKESSSFLRYHYREVYYKHLLLTSKAIFVDSNLGKQQVLESYKFVNAKLFVLPYIAPDYLYDDISALNEILKYQDLPKKYLFYAAAFWPHKNHINLLKAIKLLNKNNNNINLLLAGKKNREYRNLKKFVDENNINDQVTFLGYIPDKEIIYYYKNAFAMIMPTFYGPTNIPPIEATLLDCPSLVSNIYAMPEQMEDAALYFDPNNPQDIADKIELLLNNDDLRNVLLINGNKIKAKFSQQRFKKDLFNSFQILDQNNL